MFSLFKQFEHRPKRRN